MTTMFAWLARGRCLALGLCVLAVAPSVRAAEPDSDDDGVPDSVEDADRNGKVGQGESDPHSADTDDDGIRDGDERALKTDPTIVNIPEPLYFDTVRSVGARGGEIEVNTLTQLRRIDRAYRWTTSPEIEWTLGRGFAAELELPMDLDGLIAVRGSLQGTFAAESRGRDVYGWLVTPQWSRATGELEVTALYLQGHRVTPRASVFMMVGARVAPSLVEVIANPSLFYDASKHTTVGTEVNYAHAIGEGTSWALLPQVHWLPIGPLKIQFGMGPERRPSGAVGWLSALRVSWNVH